MNVAKIARETCFMPWHIFSPFVCHVFIHWHTLSWISSPWCSYLKPMQLPHLTISNPPRDLVFRPEFSQIHHKEVLIVVLKDQCPLSRLKDTFEFSLEWDAPEHFEKKFNFKSSLFFYFSLLSFFFLLVYSRMRTTWHTMATYLYTLTPFLNLCTAFPSLHNHNIFINGNQDESLACAE